MRVCCEGLHVRMCYEGVLIAIAHMIRPDCRQLT